MVCRALAVSLLSVALAACSLVPTVPGSDKSLAFMIGGASPASPLVEQKGFRPELRRLEIVVDVAWPALGPGESTVPDTSVSEAEYDTIAEIVRGRLAEQAKQLGYEPSFSLHEARKTLFRRSPTDTSLFAVRNVAKAITERRKQLDGHNLLYVCLPVARSAQLHGQFGGVTGTLTLAQPIFYLGFAREDSQAMLALTNQNIGLVDHTSKLVWMSRVRSSAALALSPRSIDELNRLARESAKPGKDIHVPVDPPISLEAWAGVLGRDLAQTFAAAAHL